MANILRQLFIFLQLFQEDADKIKKQKHFCKNVNYIDNAAKENIASCLGLIYFLPFQNTTSKHFYLELWFLLMMKFIEVLHVSKYDVLLVYDSWRNLFNSTGHLPQVSLHEETKKNQF